MFKKGDQVFDSFSRKTGYITGERRGDRWEVDFGGSYSFASPNELRVISGDDVFSLFKNKQFATNREYSLVLLHERLNGKLTDIFYSRNSSKAEFMPHQYKPVLKFIESQTGRLLIADEVGLGKTIEATYIWQELEVREGASNMLVIAPATLCEKWKCDLRNLFDLSADILDATSLVDKLDRHTNGIFIVSLQGIRINKQLREFLKKQNRKELFDLIVIDEAHALRNRTTEGFKTVELLRDRAKNLIMLSATPIQTSSENLFNLLNLLSPEEFYNKKEFENSMDANAERLINIINGIINGNANIIKRNWDKVKIAIREITQNDQLVLIIEKILFDEKASDVEKRVKIAALLKTEVFYESYFTRSRKKEVFKKRPIRDAKVWKYEFNEEERHKYNSIKQQMMDQGAHPFARISKERQMTSCIHVDIKDTGDFRSFLAEQDLDDNMVDYVDNDLSLKSDVPCVIGYVQDSKYGALIKGLDELLKENSHEKIIIFAHYRETVKYLYERLKKDNKKVLMIMGGDNDKYEMVKKFRDKNVNILISTEVMAEGVDLQFAGIMVNYDLPWNPMVLEQRIGRIDRIGQEREVIVIKNLSCLNSIDDQILTKLYDRINVFKNAIGDIEDILGSDISKLAFKICDLTDEQKKIEADRWIVAKETKRLLALDLENKAGLTKAFANILGKGGPDKSDLYSNYVKPGEVIKYVKESLPTRFPGTVIDIKGKDHIVVTLSDIAKQSFKEYLKEYNLSATNTIDYTSTFECESSVIGPSRPFLKWVVYLNENSNIERCSILEVAQKKLDIHTGYYTYYIEKWESDGYISSLKLKFFIYNIEKEMLLTQNQAEQLANECIINSQRYPSTGIKLDDMALNKAMQECKKEAERQLYVYKEEFRIENELRLNKQAEHLKNIYLRKKESIEKTIDKVKSEATGTYAIRMHEGRLNKNEQWYSENKAQIEEKKSNCLVRGVEVCGGIMVVI